MMPIYLDAAATTPVIPEVASYALHLMVEEFGNAGSRTHQFGSNAKSAVELSRVQIASPINADPGDVIFTSGATESNNIAILGLEDFAKKTGRRHVITSSIEHKAVLEPIERLRARGFEVDYLKVNEGGRVLVDDLNSLIREDTLLVSVMAANNETGVIQPISELMNLLPEETFFHVDAAQGFAKINHVLAHSRIDMISISAHKFGGPKGVGALVVRGMNEKRVPLSAVQFGGGQEKGLRPGTLPVHLIGAAGLASRIWKDTFDERNSQLMEYRKYLKEAFAILNPVYVGDQESCLPNILSLAIPSVDSEAFMLVVKDLISISNGSACTSHRYEPSHVLEAMNLEQVIKSGAVRISWTPESVQPDWSEVVGRLELLV